MYLSRPPVLLRLVPGETLYLYLSVTDHTVSALLLRLDLGVQKPIFYVSKTLAVIHVVWRLPHYFQVNTVIVLTEHPLQALLKRLDFMGRIAKWGTSLGAFDVQYRPRISIKGQVLVDFVAEFTPKQPKVLKIEGGKTMEPREDIWQVYVDGALNCRGAGVRIILISPEGIIVEKSF